MKRSFCPLAAPGRGTNVPSLTSVYPCDVFHTGSRPSPSPLGTVVLKITSPHDTQPLLVIFGATDVVTGDVSPAGTRELTLNVGLSQEPFRRPGKAAEVAEPAITVLLNDSCSSFLDWP